VERSRYYVSRFRSNIAQLRIWRVEGYQKYDLFVEQRVGSTFDFIDRLGRRYERAINSLSLLDEYNLSIQSNQIAQSQRAMQIKETNISNAIETIQEYGELVLIFALLPYYIMGLVSHVISSHHTIKYLIFVIWPAAALLAAHRTFRKTPAPDDKDQSTPEKEQPVTSRSVIRGAFKRHYMISTMAALIAGWVIILLIDRFGTPLIDEIIIPAINHWLHLGIDVEIDD
jgi:hypothetical protein